MSSSASDLAQPPPPPPWARPTHQHITPRLILRTARVSDAAAYNIVRADPRNSAFGGVVNASTRRSLEEQEASLLKQAEGTRRGENAFWVVVLRDLDEGQGEGVGVEQLRVEDGWLVGMTGFNSFPVERGDGDGDGDEKEKELLIGDTGVMIDHRFWRRGLAVEALEMVVQVGFEELGVGVISLETNRENEPFRGVMRTMGLGDVEREGEGGRSWVYRFARAGWEGWKEDLKRKGRWYL